MRGLPFSRFKPSPAASCLPPACFGLPPACFGLPPACRNREVYPPRRALLLGSRVRPTRGSEASSLPCSHGISCRHGQPFDPQPRCRPLGAGLARAVQLLPRHRCAQSRGHRRDPPGFPGDRQARLPHRRRGRPQGALPRPDRGTRERRVLGDPRREVRDRPRLLPAPHHHHEALADEVRLASIRTGPRRC